MHLVKIAMNNDWFLLCIGGALSAFANFLISSHFEVFTILGVLVTLVIGAFACFMRQHVPEAIGLSIVSSIPLFCIIHFFVNHIDESTSYLLAALVSAGLAVFLGIIIGSLLGSIARLFFDPNLLAHNKRRQTNL